MLALTAMLLLGGILAWGKAVLVFLYGNGRQNDLAWEDIFLTGGIVLIGLAEGAHVGALARGQSVSAEMNYFLLLLGMGLGLSVLFFLLRKLFRRKRNEEPVASKKRFFSFPKSVEERLLLGGVIGVFLCQAALIIARKTVYLEYDMTLETVRTFLEEDLLFGSNPLTGMPYGSGMPSRLKILCLPSFYAALCRLTGVSPEALVWHLVSVATLAFAYLAYRSLGRALFPESVRAQRLFLLIVGLLFFVGDSMYGLEGFGLLHGGFQGVTIRNAVLMPYLFGLCLRRKWKLAILAILAESCLVWTLYGTGMGLLTVFLYFVVTFFKNRLTDGGKEAAECRKS